MQNRLHTVSNTRNWLAAYEFGDLIRVAYDGTRSSNDSEIFIDAKHLDRIKKYKTPLGAWKFALKQVSDFDNAKRLKQSIAYARYICQSDDTPPNDSPESTPCPRPLSLPTTSALDEGISIEPKSSTPCPSVSTNAPYSGNAGGGASPLFIDTETTGLGYDDEIVEIAVVDIDENIIFESLVKPSKPIPAKATKVHGITNAMVASAPTFAEIWNNFSTVCASANLIFYNKDFDRRMIVQSASKSFDTPKNFKFYQLFDVGNAPRSCICLMRQYAQYWGDLHDYHQSYKWQTLLNACIQQKIPINDIPNHRASGDAIKTARLYKVLSSAGVVS